MRALLPAAIGASAVIAAAGGLHAFDNTQFCQAVTQLVRAAGEDVGTWVDRSTRNDGVEIICNRKLVHFKRFARAPAPALSGDWKEAKTEEWRGAYCTSALWREAIENGWLISATVTTSSGERVWFACQPGGIGFHRVLP
jgi:hypothetical protein